MNYNFANYDIFSNRIGFFFQNEEKIGTYFGLFLTLVYIIFSIILFILYMILTVQRSNMKVYDFVEYSKDIPVFEIDTSSIYFAFGLEDPQTSTRFIDETIYFPKISYINKNKVNGQFETNEKIDLDYEICKEENFGDDYKYLISKEELNNSYCLKNYNLTLFGGNKYNKMSYLRIKIYPCINTTENNNHCKPQEIIDYYLNGTYFSILSKDIRLNPNNYSFPVIPTLQELYTTIDKTIHRDLILYYGITEIKTDIGLFFENIKITKYLQFRKESKSFYFRNESEYGEDICTIDFRLDNLIYNQKRAYTKIYESLSLIGGYMQLIYTIFTLLSMLTNRLIPELKILNGIFNFNLKQKKISMKINNIKDLNTNEFLEYSNLYFPEEDNIFNKNNKKENNISNITNVSRNSLIKNDNNENNTSIANIFKTKRQSLIIQSNLKEKEREKEIEKINEINNGKAKLNEQNEKKENNINVNYNDINNNNNNNNNNGNNQKYIYRVGSFFPKKLINMKESQKNFNIINEFPDKINFNIFDYYCFRFFSRKKKNIELYNLGLSLYKKRMDIINVFTLLLLTEKKNLKNEQ